MSVTHIAEPLAGIGIDQPEGRPTFIVLDSHIGYGFPNKFAQICNMLLAEP
jgi:hypothetical protein